ncbi:hypothetical protein [Streptomyces sp. NPDC015125]|uniref:hypothetical protein n=1 Tax=Streptomyces sp. NPDC015125 TaxID=3364938 RepID=UPI0037023BB3
MHTNHSGDAYASPRGRLREALMHVGEKGHIPEADLSAAVRTALRELAVDVLGERSRVELVTVGEGDHPWGRSVGLRLADYDAGLPELLWCAGESDLPPEVQEKCPSLSQEEWEAGLLVAKLVLTVLASEPGPVSGSVGSVPGPVPDDGAERRLHASRPARSISTERFYRALAAIAEGNDLHPDDITAQLRTTLLDFASETPDNKDAVQHIAVQHIAVRHTEQPWQGARLCLGRSGFAFTQVLLSAEGCSVPSCVRDAFPDLTQDEWNAVIQVTGLVLLAFEADPVSVRDSP